MDATHPIGRCPANGQQGHRVERRTLQSLLLVDLRSVPEGSYWFCPATSCPIAYFGDSGEVMFTTEEVRVPIWQKQPADPETLICYCFKITNSMLGDDTVAEITAGIQRDLCACSITNPQGSCCLGNVHHATKGARSISETRSPPIDRGDT